MYFKSLDRRIFNRTVANRINALKRVAQHDHVELIPRIKGVFNI